MEEVRFPPHPCDNGMVVRFPSWIEFVSIKSSALE